MRNAGSPDSGWVRVGCKVVEYDDTLIDPYRSVTLSQHLSSFVRSDECTGKQWMREYKFDPRATRVHRPVLPNLDMASLRLAEKGTMEGGMVYFVPRVTKSTFCNPLYPGLAPHKRRVKGAKKNAVVGLHQL